MGIEQVLGPLPSGWKYLPLGEACKQGRGGIQTGPFGSQLHASDYVASGIPVVMPKNIGENRIVPTDIARITTSDAKRLTRHRVELGDILYSRRGDVERRALIREEEAGWLCGTGCLRVRMGELGANPIYSSYYLGHPAVREWIVRHAQGATMLNLNTSILSACPFVLPPVAEQQAIASVLGALDDKIDCNRRMNETLEAMARAMFKDWFVDFGPTKAKMEGRAPYLAPEIWDLFPDRLDDEGKPKEWEYSEIGKETKVLGGATPSTKEPTYWEGGTHHWATPKDLSGLASPVLLDTARKITDQGVAKISSGSLPIGTVLLSSRAPVGYLAIAEVETAINQGFIAMICKKRLSNLFVLLWCAENMEYIKSISGGSTFAEISKKAFRPIPVTIPGNAILRRFEELATPLYQQIVVNSKEQYILAQTRDLLLPKLMSGEIRIKDAERAVEDKL